MYFLRLPHPIRIILGIFFILGIKLSEKDYNSSAVRLSGIWDSLFSKRCEMVRGCQKKMIYLKNTGSEVFDEAYFVVSDKKLGEELSECDLVKEANKILDECIFVEESGSLTYKILEFLKRKTIPFLIGMFFGIVIVLIIK